MKFLLVAINAKYIHSNPAIYSLKAYAGEIPGVQVELAEYTINQQQEEILADIYGRRPDAVGFSCYIWNSNMVRGLLAELPKLLPEIKLWLGGPEATYDGETLLSQYPMLTGIMVGEGEATFRELLEYYGGSGEKGLKDIAGLCLPTGYTASRGILDMNELPFPYGELEAFENKIIYYETSRGCPFRCSYCLSSVEKSVRMRSMDKVKKELQYFLDNRVKQVKFVDRTFNCNREHAIAVWQYLKENDNSVTNFHFEISADLLREEEIDLLNSLRPGLVQLEIGVQSVNPATLKAIERVMDLERLEAAVEKIRIGGRVHQHLDLIAGLPYEDYESFRNSFNRVYRMRPEQLQLGFLKVLKGSAMAEKAKQYGIRYLSCPPYEVLSTDWLSYEDILRLKRIEKMLELYYNSGQFGHTLPILERVFTDPFSMYEELGNFYERKDYLINSPARAHRYQVLLDFAGECDRERLPLYRELLTYDMFLRENLKSRPDFAADIAPYKEEIRCFYRREEEAPRYLEGYKGYDSKQLSKMTHLEPFRYPVWDAERLAQELPDGKRSGQESAEGGLAQEASNQSSSLGFVLFDYSCRNPLNHEAATYVVFL